MEYSKDEDIYAVQLYFQSNDGKVLGVSRRNDHGDFGLPGGKVDKGETPILALIREVKEETGIDLKEEYIKPIYEGLTRSGKISRTYSYNVGIEALNFTEGIHEDNGGLAKFITWSDLIGGSFAIYNYRLGILLQRFLPFHWLISYVKQTSGELPIFNNKLIDVHPLSWLASMKRSSDDVDFTIISFQEVDLNDINTYGHLYN